MVTSSPSQGSMFAGSIARRDPDERFTPGWVFDALGETFDLDPASPVDGGDAVPAARKLTRDDDGLAHTWEGRVWLNPPFSNATPWADRFREHGSGVFLGPVANARWWIDLAGVADVILHTRDFPFNHPTHRGRRSSMPLAFIAIGERDALAVTRLAARAPIDSVLVARIPAWEQLALEVDP